VLFLPYVFFVYITEHSGQNFFSPLFLHIHLKKFILKEYDGSSYVISMFLYFWQKVTR